MVRIVLDTNVLINADRGSGSYGRRILALAQQGQVTGVVSHAVRRENELIISRLVRDQELHDEFAHYLAMAEEVQPAEVAVPIDDEEDIKLLAAAVGGQVKFLITEDKHLLDVGEYQGVTILRPAEFWQWWQRQQDEQGASWASWAGSILGK